MTKLLLRIFVKNHEDTENPAVREAYGKLGGAVGIVSNLCLCLMKVIAGVVTNSIAIIADGINNLADASSSVMTLIGFKLASRPEDKAHPYGYARIEYLTGLAVSVLIIIVGVELFKTSFGKVLHPEDSVWSVMTVVILVAAIGIKIWQAVFNISLGKKINSLALIATGTDSRNDVISTSAVLAALIVTKLTGFQLDGYMGCLVALFIIWSGISLVRETISPLLGEAPDDELVKNIHDRAMKYDGVIGIHDLMVHNYGPGKIFASMHIEVDAKADIMESHDMIDNIECAISRDLRIMLTVHMDPVVTSDPELNRLKELIANEAKALDGVYGIHDFRMVSGPTHTNVIFDAVLEPSSKLTEDEVREILQERLKRENPKYIAVITIDRAYTNLG